MRVSRVGYRGIGPVEIGRTVAEASRAAPTTLVSRTACLVDVADPEPASGLTPGAVSFGVVDGRVVVVDVGDPRIRIISGVHVHSREADVDATYGNVAEEPGGDPSFHTLRITNPEGRVVRFFVSSGSVTGIQVVASDEAWDRLQRRDC